MIARGQITITVLNDGENPNILLRTVFDRGMDFVKEKWTCNRIWDYINIPTETHDTEVDGRLSVRVNAGNLLANEYVDFVQDVYTSLKPSTWYTLSFNYSATHQFDTFLWDGVGSVYVVDASAGMFADGEQVENVGMDGCVHWPAEWQMKRHTLTFKTSATLDTTAQHFFIIFRTYHQAHIEGGVEQNDRAQTALCMPKLETGKVATAYMPNEDDLRGEDGDSGDTIREVTIYKWSDAAPQVPQSSAVPPTEWTLEGVKGVNVNDKFTLESPGDDGKTLKRLYIITTQDNASVTIKATASSEEDYDLVALGKLDGTELERSITASDISDDDAHEYCVERVSGNNYFTHTYQIPTAGVHFVDAIYIKDSSVEDNEDKGYIEVTAGTGLFDCSGRRQWKCWGTLTNGVLTDGWYGVVQANGEDASIISVTPEYAIFEEVLENSQAKVDTTQWSATIQIFVGGERKQITTFSPNSNTYVKAKVNCDIDATSLVWSENNQVLTFKFKTINTHTVDGITTHYESGYVTLLIKAADDSYQQEVKIPFYVNRLATFQRTIEGGVETAIGRKVGWYDEDHDIYTPPTETSWMYKEVNDATQHIRTIEESVGGMDNLLLGSESFTADSKLEHKSSAADGIIEYTGANGTQHIYTPIQLVAGEKYTLQCKTDGTLAASHGTTPENQGKYTIWLRIDSTYQGQTYNGEVFTSANLTGTIGDAKYWTFECKVSGEYWFRTNTYSPNGNEVTVHFWDIMLQKGSIPSGWVAPSRGTMSQIKQTAHEIDLSVRADLATTGININGDTKTILLSAEHTTIDGDLSVPRVISEGNGTYTKMEVGQFELGIVETKVINGVQTKIQIPAFQLELDDDGNAILRYMNKDGQTIGLIDESFFSQQAVGDSWVQITVIPIRDLAFDDDYPSYDDIEQTLQFGGATAIYYQYNEGYVLSGTTKRYNISGKSTPSDYNGKWFTSKFSVVNRTPTPTPTPMPISPFSAFINPNALPYRRLIDMNHYQDVYVYYQALRQLEMTTVLKMEAAGDNHPYQR